MLCRIGGPSGGPCVVHVVTPARFKFSVAHILLMIACPRPGENPYAYLERLRRQLGTDYVYLLQGGDVVSAARGRVNLDLAQVVLDTASHLVSNLPETLNGVIAEPADVPGKIHVYRIGGSSFVVAYVPEQRRTEGAVMRFEELVV